MNKSVVLALAAAGTLLAAGAAQAANVSWSLGINLPVPGLVITGGPVYQEPGRYYQNAPVPVYAPEPVYYQRQPQWRHRHYRPAPVIEVPRYQPRYQPGWQPVAYPHHHDERRDWRDR